MLINIEACNRQDSSGTIGKFLLKRQCFSKMQTTPNATSIENLEPNRRSNRTMHSHNNITIVLENGDRGVETGSQVRPARLVNAVRTELEAGRAFGSSEINN